ncbi:MAG TPA: hypothetical protein VK791_11860 [bacterium]|jgi:hypothetical protein|nr:hypothetical protein [bacterium]
MKKSPNSQKPDSLASTFWQGLLALVGGVKPFIHHLQTDFKKKLRHYAKVIEQRILAFIFRGTTLFLSVIFITFGFLFVLMDYANLSRAVACLCCGLFALLVFSISIHLTK